MKETVIYPFKPIYDKNSKILILGTMPSPNAREVNFYYGHPQNRFWKVICDIFNENDTIIKEEKKALLLKNNIALWDVIYSCEIEKSKDSSIKNVIPNNINSLIKNTKINTVFTTGKTAYELYNKYCFPNTKIKAICLPSTSPANCRVSYEQLKKEYFKILNHL